MECLCSSVHRPSLPFLPVSLSLSLSLSPSLCKSSASAAFVGVLLLRSEEMKVLCDVCDKAQATIMCCADEAALCADCDNGVHAANKLASKHQRVPLLYPSTEELPSCDICQDKTGYFFCLEDRALLCRNCDYSIHSVNALAAKHKRFLVTGIRVALQVITAKDASENTQAYSPSQISSPTTQISQLSSPTMATSKKLSRINPATSTITNPPTPIPQQPSLLYAKPTREKATVLNVVESLSIPQSSSTPKQSRQVSPTTMFLPDVVGVPPSNMGSAPVNQQVHFSSGRQLADWGMCSSTVDVNSHDMNSSGVLASQRGSGGGGVKRSSISEYLTEAIPGWKVDELLNLPDMEAIYTFTDCGPSKTDASNFGADWPADCSSFDDSMLGEALAEVPSFPSPPTASGVPRLVKPWGLGKFQKRLDLDYFLGCDDTLVVPDIGGVSSPAQSPTSPPQKRRRTFLDF